MNVLFLANNRFYKNYKDFDIIGMNTNNNKGLPTANGEKDILLL